MRTGKLFTSIFTKSSPAGTFLSDSKWLPNWEKLPCYENWNTWYDEALEYLPSTMNKMPRKTEVGQQLDE